MPSVAITRRFPACRGGEKAVTTNLLITGGAGFIGCNLIAHLAARGGYRITVLDNESLGQRREIDTAGVRFLHGDIRSTAALAEALAGQNAVVHLAAETRVVDSIADPEGTFAVNAEGSFRLLQAARAAGVGQIVAASTGGAILGEAPAPIDETMAARPLSPYGASKLAMEGYLSAFAGAYGMRTCALRFSNVYGPRSHRKGSVVAQFFRAVLRGEPLTVYGDGTQVRDYLYIGDLVEGIRRALDAGAAGVYQLGSGQGTPLNALIAAMARTVGRESLPLRFEPFRAGEVHTTWCAIGRARAAFGFEAATGLDAGLARTWDWFSSAPRY